MADNPVWPPTGLNVAADDIGGNLHQRVKLSLGADGTAVDAGAGAGAVGTDTLRCTLGSNDPAVTALQIMDDWDESDRAKVNLIVGQAGIAAGTGVDGATVPRVTLATNVPLPAGTNAIGKLAANTGVDIGDVDVTSISAGENHLGEVGGNTSVFAVTFSLDTSAYATGDVLAASQAMTSCLRKVDGSGLLTSIVLNDKDDQGVALDVVILSANVSIGTENAGVSISDADADSILAIIPVGASDWIDLGGCRVATIRNLGVPVKAVSGTSDLYVALITRGAPTYTASGITGRFGFLRD